jgi:hypothetical protein
MHCDTEICHSDFSGYMEFVMRFNVILKNRSKWIESKRDCGDAKTTCQRARNLPVLSCATTTTTKPLTAQCPLQSPPNDRYLS